MPSWPSASRMVTTMMSTTVWPDPPIGTGSS